MSAREVYSTPKECAVWEAVALLALMQSLDEGDIEIAPGAHSDVYKLGAMVMSDWNVDNADFDLHCERAYRRIEDMEDTWSYAQMLATTNGVEGVEVHPPVFLGHKQSTAKSEGIVLCPTALKSDLDLSNAIWTSTAKLLRTYSQKLLLIGGRIDGAQFLENEMYVNDSFEEKLYALSTAELVVGPPNEWLWIAFGMKKKIVCLYPDHIPVPRWLPWYDEGHQAVLLYTRHQVQSAIVNYGLRKLIGAL